MEGDGMDAGTPLDNNHLGGGGGGVFVHAGGLQQALVLQVGGFSVVLVWLVCIGFV